MGEVWKEVDYELGFNALFLHKKVVIQYDFIKERLNDDWVTVFLDEKNIILIKNNYQNKNIVEKYGINSGSKSR